MSELSQSIQSQTGYNISYNSDNISYQFQIKLSTTKMNLSQTLSYLKKQYNISHKIIGNTIILSKSNKPKNNTASTSGRTSKNKPSKKNKHNSHSTNTPSITQNTKSKPVHSNKLEKEFIPSEIQHSERTPKRHFLFQNKKSTINSYKTEKKSYKALAQRFNSNFNLNIGVQAEETFYVNPFVEIGYKNLMFTTHYAIRDEFVSHLRWGLKFDIEINEKSRMGLEINYGQFQKPLHFNHIIDIPEDDSLGTPPIFEEYDYYFHTQNELYKAGLSYQYVLTEHLDIKFGVYANVLNINIQSLNEALAIKPYDMHPAILDRISYKDFSTLDVPYNMYNNFDIQQSTYTRMWLGVHVGVRYRFFK